MDQTGTTIIAILLIIAMGYVIWRWTIYGKMARGMFRGGRRQVDEMRALMEMSRMARQIEARLPPTVLEWGKAWIAAWGNATPDAMLRRGADTRGPVSERFRSQWETDRQASAEEYIQQHWQEIAAACEAQPRCPECGTWRGNHAAYCTRKNWMRPPDMQPSVREPVKEELASLAVADPTLVPEGYTADLLVALLDNLLRQRVGAYARLGNESGAPWILLPDTFEGLQTLNRDERTRLSGPCGYVRQRTMLPTMMDELLEEQP